MPAHFENGEKCDGCKIWASVHTISEQFENGKKLDGKNSLQDFDAKEVYLHPNNRPVSFQKHLKMFHFSSCSGVYRMSFPKCAGYSSIFKIYRFQNLPAKIVPFSCERKAYPLHFSPFSNYAGIVWKQSKFNTKGLWVWNWFLTRGGIVL